METSKMLEAAANKSLLGATPTGKEERQAPSGRLYTVVDYDGEQLIPDSLVVSGMTTEGRFVNGYLLSKFRNDDSVEAALASLKHDFFITSLPKEKQDETV